jgi:excisionase family DNA binding protein
MTTVRDHSAPPIGATTFAERFKTVSVPEAGAFLGLSRGAAYDAAARGQLPTIRLGRLLRVPVVALDAMVTRATEKAGG